MNTKELDVITIDYDARAYRRVAKDRQPLVYHDGDAICVMAGETQMGGIFGCGRTLEEALKN